MLKKLKISPFLITLLIITAGVSVYLAGIPFFDLMELKTIDLRFQARGTRPPNPSIVIATIDEKSIDQEGKWIWPRKKMADLITSISKAGARVIALDIGFIDPDDKGVQKLQEIGQKIEQLGIKNLELTHYLNELTMASDNDRLLARAIKNAKAHVVLGYFFQMSAEDAIHVDEALIRSQTLSLQSSCFQSVQCVSEQAFNTPFIEAVIPEANIPAIAAATPYSGFFNMMPDKDGVIRWIPGILKFRGALYAHMSLKALAAFTDSPLNVRVADHGVSSLQVGDISVPTDELGRIMINYRGGTKTFPHISATDILNGQVPVTRLKDKLVIIGVTAVGIYDLRVTPFDSVFPGVEVHANLIDSILSKDFLYQPAWAAVFDIMAILVAGLLLGGFLPRLKVIPGAMLAIIVISGYIYICYYLFSVQGIVLNVVYPTVVTIFVYVSISAYRYLVEESHKRFIKDAFSTYLAPAVVEQLCESPDKLVLGGEKRDITAFFSDVEGFTSISEKLTPEALVDLLNEFLTEMTDIIFTQNGTVDKFEGDAIIAMFGAPISLDSHEEAACTACIEMQKRLAVLREKWQKEKNLTIRMRIGLCSGPAVVGNMGSKNRMDYTMMGDTVNTAARLEGVNKVYGTYTMISETTYDGVKDRFVARELDAINVVGKSVPVKVYQLIGHKDTVDNPMMQTISAYAKGLDAYRNREWDQAVSFFKQTLAIIPDDSPSSVMIDRCHEYKSDPPETGWNGAFVMKTK
jgi:adenylate cyclase